MLACILCLVAGCAGPTKTAQPASQPESPDDGEAAALSLVRYTNALRSLTPDELDAEHLRMEQQLASHWTSEAALRMSVLLTTPGAGLRDEGRARALLLTVEAGGPETLPAESELASFLLLVLAERDAWRGAYEAETSDASADGDVVAPEVETLRRALAAERTRRGELEQQVRALKRIEQNLNEREHPPD